uniref:Virion structural protein n=1 Tax=Pantoea phage Survivor TaxID=3232176 RepID=A0AAU8L0F0_9CAUD
MSDMIDLTNADLGIENLGEFWKDFTERCTPEQAKLFSESYNLIAISFPDSFIDSTLTHLLADDGLNTSELISHVRLLFINTICDALQMMGIFVDKDYMDMNSLHDVKVILDTIYLFDGMTDLIGLVDVLNNEELDCKERFIKVVKMTQPQYELSDIDSYIREVSVNTIRGILIGLNIIDEDDTEWVDHTTRQRIKDNKEWLAGTLAREHVSNGGGVGLLMDNYLKLFHTDLSRLLLDDPTVYLRNVLSLMIISSLTDRQIHGQFNALIEDQCTTVEEVYKATAILKGASIDA